MEAAIKARSSCARMAYTANARATTTIRETNHRLYLLMLKNDTFFGFSNHSRYQRQPTVMASSGSWSVYSGQMSTGRDKPPSRKSAQEALERLSPHRTHESSWFKALLCAVGLHRWYCPNLTDLLP